MNGFMDTVMLVLFVLFMFGLFGGYHKDKYAKREAEEQRQKEKELQEDSSKES
ncbi:MAG: hypothetical protein GXO11_01560 [Epsilonproteobacteria bacterium]|nr:hypothetical protein [Campylobacterota bacterium]